MEALLQKIIEFYQKPENIAGGLLHIVLDDGNLEDGNIEFCLEEAEKFNDTDAIFIAKELLKLEYTDREELYDDFWDNRHWKKNDDSL